MKGYQLCEKSIFPNIFCLKIGRNENFIMQMAYGDKKIFYDFLFFIIEKLWLLIFTGNYVLKMYLISLKCLDFNGNYVDFYGGIFTSFLWVVYTYSRSSNFHVQKLN